MIVLVDSIEVEDDLLLPFAVCGLRFAVGGWRFAVRSLQFACWPRHHPESGKRKAKSLVSTTGPQRGRFERSFIVNLNLNVNVNVDLNPDLIRLLARVRQRPSPTIPRIVLGDS